MNGNALVALDELVCLCADTTEPVVAEIRAWADENGLGFEAHPVGATVDVRDDVEALGLAVGGDGTFLEAIRTFAPRSVPVAGINRGTLAFLARIPPAEATAALEEIYGGEARVLPRQQFGVSGPGVDATGINDVIVEPLPGEGTKLTRDCALDVFVDEEYVGQYEGGGINVNPPTGSTAMALSAGGPIHHPDGTETLQIMPLHPDTPGVRPVVLAADREVTVVPDRTVRLVVDGGRTVATLDPATRLTVSGADRPALVVRTSHEQSFLDALVDKLGWAIRGDEPTERPADAATRLGAGSASVGPRRRDGAADPHDSQEDGSAAERPEAVARDAAVAAGELVKRYRPRLADASGADRRELLETAARKSERVLVSTLSRTFPEHDIAPCSRDRARDSDRKMGALGDRDVWVLDPLDGYTNFEHGNPNYCTSVALVSDGRPVVGVVHAPETGETFHATRGGKARRNGVPIEPTDRDALAESMLLSGYDPDGQFLRLAYHHTRGVRRLGSQALNLCFIAAGSADALWEYDTYVEDVAAGLCILRAAGGRVTDAAGVEYRLDSPGRSPLLASNGPLHESARSLLAESMAGDRA